MLTLLSPCFVQAPLESACVGKSIRLEASGVAVSTPMAGLAEEGPVEADLGPGRRAEGLDFHRALETVLWALDHRHKGFFGSASAAFWGLVGHPVG